MFCQVIYHTKPKKDYRQLEGGGGFSMKGDHTKLQLNHRGLYAS